MLVGLFVLGALVSVTPAFAERPIAPRLLPEQTLAYLRVASTPDMIQRFHQTSTGKLAQDEKLKPLLGQFWQIAVNAFQRIENEIEVSLNDLLAIPQGEICLAIVAPEKGRPQIVGWLDCGDRILTMNKLLDRAEQEMANGGATRSTEVLGDVELVVHEFQGSRQRRLAYFIKDQAFFFSSDPNLAKQILTQWAGSEAEEVLTLADNKKFTAIMSRSMGTKGEEPQITWFVDPIELARRGGRGNASTQTGLAIISGLGIDGVKGIGGSIAFATEDFDSIFHLHVSLENPRKGVIEALALRSGDVDPEPWVPADVESYTTLNWDVSKTYSEIVRLYELFRGGEGAWKDQVLMPINDRLGIDFDKDVIQAVAGRATLLTWMDKPARLNSQSAMFGVKLIDADASRRVLAKVADRFSDVMTRKSYGGVEYFEIPVTNERTQELNEEVFRRNIICIAVFDDYLLLGNNPKLLQNAIITKSDGTRSLGNELDFKIVASKIKRQLGEAEAGLIAFNRPEEGLRQLYDLAVSQTVRGQLKTQADSNQFFKGLNDALETNPLPPFSVLAQYLAPGGALLTTDETGFHYMAFSLKRD